MEGKFHIVSVNQDPNLSSGRHPGAARQLNAMRKAFRQLGAQVTEVDESDARRTQAGLEKVHCSTPVSLIYERHIPGRSIAAAFARANGVPYSVEINTPPAEETECRRDQIEEEKIKRNDQIIFASASLIRAVSGPAADYARGHGGRSGAITVSPHGIDTSLFRAGIRGERRPFFRPPRNRFVLGFHGPNRPGDGFEMLVDMTRTLLARSYPVHLFVIGRGSFRALAKLPPCSYTRMACIGYEDMPACLASLDALPLTYSEPCACHHSSLNLIESMACGAVPVVPEAVDMPVPVKPGINSLVYSPGDAEALIEQIVALLSNRDWHRELGQQAATDARAYDWIGIAGMVLDRLCLWPEQGRMGMAVSH